MKNGMDVTNDPNYAGQFTQWNNKQNQGRTIRPKHYFRCVRMPTDRPPKVHFSVCNSRTTERIVVTFHIREFHLHLQGNFNFHLQSTVLTKAARGGAFALGTALQAGRSRDRFPMGSLGFFFDIIQVDSDYNINGYQKYLLVVKAAGE